MSCHEVAHLAQLRQVNRGAEGGHDELCARGGPVEEVVQRRLAAGAPAGTAREPVQVQPPAARPAQDPGNHLHAKYNSLAFPLIATGAISRCSCGAIKHKEGCRILSDPGVNADLHLNAPEYFSLAVCSGYLRTMSPNCGELHRKKVA